MATDYGVRYCFEDKGWYTRSPDGVWVPDTINGAGDYLVQKGISPKPPNNRFYSDVDLILRQAKDSWYCHSAGCYAGYFKAGDIIIKGKRVLILEDVPLPTPVPGNCDMLKELFNLAFPKQALVLHSWIHWTLVELRNGKPGEWHPGQAMVWIGDPGAGKTALQGVLTQMFTGRSCDPSMYMSDRTPFNYEMGICEHWTMSDPRPKNSKDTAFLGELKKAVANVEMPYHAKNKHLRSIPTFRRLTISLNRDNEALQILHGVADSDLDKLIILDFEEPGQLAPDAPGGLEYSDWYCFLVAEIPAYLYWNIHDFKIPTHLFHKRYGVVYHNPEIEPEIAATSTENKDAEIAGSCFRCAYL